MGRRSISATSYRIMLLVRCQIDPGCAMSSALGLACPADLPLKRRTPVTEEMKDGNSEDGGPDEHYQAALQKYVAALGRAVAISHRTAGLRAGQRQYWASVLFTRLCSIGTSICRLCPASPLNADASHWDFSSLASLVRNFFQGALMLSYLGTEAVGEDESRARLLVMQLCDCTERLRLFRHPGASRDQAPAFQEDYKTLRAKLLKNSHFMHLPSWLRKNLLKGGRASILTQDQLLDRMGTFDQKTRLYIQFISSHADFSPLAYYRTGHNKRGTGDQNEIDTLYMATAIDLAGDMLLRATSDVQDLFRDSLAPGPPKPASSEPVSLFQTASRQVLRWEGGLLGAFTDGDDIGGSVLCSRCFRDEGLRLSSIELGLLDFSKCPNCGSAKGRKLSKRAVEILAHQFFVWGTLQRCEYGGYPTVQFNRDQPTSIEVPPWLAADLRLIERILQVGFFGYGPRLWMVGEVEPLKALQEPSTRANLVARILDEYPGRLLNTDECFYRLRKAPARPQDFEEYDSPPTESVGTGRFDSVGLPILYCSQDIEVCLHECRVAAEDEIYLATLGPRRRLRLLNLAEVLDEEHVTEFESLDIAVHMLFLAGRHSYEISREIASAARQAGFDGLVYPSYFSLLRSGEMPFATTFGISHRRIPQLREHVRKSTIANLALFGRPVRDAAVEVQCINRVILNRVKYNLHFGPAPIPMGGTGSAG